MIPSFKVPAEYFYALTANLPIDVGVDIRYQMVVSGNAKKTVDDAHAAMDAGVIVTTLPITPEQAARRLTALGSASGNGPTVKPNTGLALVTAWLTYVNPMPTDDPDADVAPFWATVLAPVANMTLTDPALAGAHLELIVCAVINDSDPVPLIGAVKAKGFTLNSVKDLDPTAFGGAGGITPDQWKQIFANHPDAIPAFAKIGTNAASPQAALGEQTAAFVRRLTQLFNMAAVPAGSPALGVGGRPELERPQASQDALTAFVAAYTAQPGHAGFAFGQTTALDAGAAQAAAAGVFPDDARAQAWLAAAAGAVNTDYAVANVAGVSSGLRYAIAEALFARGFATVESITALTPADFQDALIGTVGYPYAAQIQALAGSSAAPTPPGTGTFGPINDGTLTNCVPPPWLSPLGPVAYLHDLWTLSRAASCESPSGDGVAPTLGSVVTARRGPLGDLLATRANLETALPRIDLVNECLEQLVANGAVNAVYQTAGDTLAGHVLGEPGKTPDEDAVPYRHDPQVLFAALPEHSTPGAPLAAAYAKLESDFSAPVLPYAQSLDTSRSYLEALRTTRYATLRRLRKDITEFVLEPANQPADFASYRWRYPVRIDIACEYLAIAPDEYAKIFTADLTSNLLAELYGFDPKTSGWMTTVATLSEFLARTGLSYCEFIDLWRSRYVRFDHASPGTKPDPDFPLCEPCYLDKMSIVFDNPPQALTQLIVFIRLWQKLRTVAGARYDFTTLADIATVLQLFTGGTSINPDFIRQVAAFQMLRDDFALPLRDEDDAAPGTGAERTHLLALFVVPASLVLLPRKWGWAVEQLIRQIGRHSRARHAAKERPSEFIRILTSNLDPLSDLAGFDSAVAARRWHASPTHALRFAEILSKIYASHFTVGEILFLFGVARAPQGDDPFELPDLEDSLELPLLLPDDDGAFSLWDLRHRLLQVEIGDEDCESWSWARVARALQEDFGFAAAVVQALGTHFFPEEHRRAGTTVTDSFYRVKLAAASTSPQMWNTPPDGPFHYDTGTEELCARVPLCDAAVLEKLSRIRSLSDTECAAVRDLYYLLRIDLAPFAFLFATFDEADHRLIQERDDVERWRWFRRAFALCRVRCEIIVRYLDDHVAAASGARDCKDERLVWRLLRQLLADENEPNPPTPWEADSGQPPAVAWPKPTGGAFAALLGLLGSGLLGEFRQLDTIGVQWREMRGPFSAFGQVRNAWNAPVPTVFPSLGAALPPDQTGLMDVRNGICLSNLRGHALGGADGCCVTWRGVLLVEAPGPHEFFADVHCHEGDPPGDHGLRWRVTLRRGQKAWVVLAHAWPGHEGGHSSVLPLKPGAYDIEIDLQRCAPDFRDGEQIRPLRTGFELKYAGPDTGDDKIALPLHRLYQRDKSGPLSNDLSDAIQGNAKTFLGALYVSTLRDVRRTYQRAFKGLLLARRFELGAETFADYGQSEIGFVLDHADQFAGMAFYDSGGWKTHRAGFDLDFLPVGDPYESPAGDQRAAPSLPRRQALFDWWERLFDYVQLRRQVRLRTGQPVWLLFDDATVDAGAPPEDPTQLVRYLGINASYAPLVLAYDPGYGLTAAQLVDERWPVRVWKAEEWMRGLERACAFKDIRSGRPDLWASDDPGASGGNANLTKLIQDACIEKGPPRRYEDLKKLNDGLRERARRAMIAYLCGPNGEIGAHTAKDLSDRLLIDVETGLCDRASRVEDAVSAVQAYEACARLGLEPDWAPTPGFASLWDVKFASFRIWQACMRNGLYREDWIEWSEFEKARRTEGFRFLENELRRATLTVPVPGGLTWWDGARPPSHPGLKLLQAREPATISLVPDQPEALDLLGTPERSARRSWLASIPGVAAPPPPPPPPPPLSNPPNVLFSAVGHGQAPPIPASGKLPFWIEAAARLGVRFLRIAAAGVPPASNAFAPHHRAGAAGCCQVCGLRHEAVIDEYYFWLVDSRYFTPDDITQDANANWDDDVADQNGDLPKLLAWTPRQSVYLMWSRMHDGVLQQPRRSTDTVAVDPAQAPWSLKFDGRTDDSLYFEVVGAAPPDVGYPPAPPVGFRYDLAIDAAIALPQLANEPPAPTFAGGLPSYPYFAYFAPGAPLVPLSMFSESIAVACTLRNHCRFEAALKWYEAFYDPLHNDVRWCWESLLPPPNPNPTAGRPDTESGLPPAVVRGTPAAEVPPRRFDGNSDGCCRFSDVTDDVARQRAITLDYIDTLVAWGDAVWRKDAPEAYQQARLLFDTAGKLLGVRPVTVMEHSDIVQPVPTVANLNPSQVGVPLNPRLLALYDRVADRQASIRACLDSHRLRNGRPHRDMPYWTGAEERRWADDHVCCAGCGCHDDFCAGEDDWCCLPSPYRFTFLVQKAAELAGEVRAFGASLLSAFEKGDAEYIAYVRASHEKQLAELGLAIRADAFRAADWDVQALKKSKESAQNQLQYYTGLISAGLNTGENTYVSLENSAIGALQAAVVSQTIATILGPIPDTFVGTSDFTWLPIGTKLAGVFSGIGQISSTTSQILSSSGGLSLTQSTWDRRLAEWYHQADIYTIEIEQIERQILAAERRRDSARHDLNNTRRQIEQSREMLNILRDKFTNHDLYLYLQKETAALHREMYELALRAARHAQRAFNYERGFTARDFIPGDLWRDLREGLLAGEQLTLALKRMDKAYCDENVREYELSRHISLRQLFPAQFLQLKTTGRCEIELPEWLFDLDYPGHYMRRIKSMALTTACVAGPFAGVHCRLTLLASATRVVPWLLEPVARCCETEPALPPAPPACGCWMPEHAHPRKDTPRRDTGSGYELRPGDPRIVKRYGAKDAIATSSGVNDSGLFELNFRDERYLPFEFEGAVSRWRIELPPENNYFDMDSLSEVVLHLNYTAREGGDVLRRAASEDAQRNLPDAGRRVFDVRQEFADAWQRFEAPVRNEQTHRQIELRIGREMFMYLPGPRDVTITRIEVFFEAPSGEQGEHRTVEFVLGHRRGCKHAARRPPIAFECRAGSDWPGYYRGVLDLRLGPLFWREREVIGSLRFHRAHGDIRNLYLVCDYESGERVRMVAQDGEWHREEHRDA
jgi:hypothetical protein